ncbi:MAG: DNA repair protein RecN [Deltaproteobacteria bacterium]|nr:MAG: DNA repair protein RecN [Deltaproteobacteria bacterium]
MLRTLKLRDLAIIDELELVLEPGLNVITGETGAGKSILLQALDAALGGRPDADLVRTGAEEAAVEALFTGAAPPAYAVLAAAGIAADDEIVIRRVIAAGGRTRAYVNDALGSLGLLRDLAPHLLRAYGQEEHHALRRVESHRELLDGIGGLVGAVEEMRRRHARLQAATQAVAERREAERTAAERVELLRFQASELAGARLVPGEQETLGAERSRLAHAERLAALVAAAEAGVYSGDASAVGTLGRALGGFAEAERLDASLEPTRRLLESALAELEEAGAALGRYLSGIAPDPARLEAVEQRLGELARLRRKYGGTVEDLIRRREEVVAELERAAGGGEALAALEAAAESGRRAAAEWAGRLSVERRRVARELERDLGRELATLALDDARFAVRFGEGRALGPEGWDEIEFFLSANPGEEPRSLARIASGGELSRIMLALKTLAAAEERGATLIFDEVDAGIGGAVAEAVGRKLAQLGRSRQVLCITHLPLIAAFAEHHIAVTKRVHAGRTTSTARPLTATERVAELARMLGGARLTRETREHAEHLLQQARPRKARREAAQT